MFKKLFSIVFLVAGC